MVNKVFKNIPIEKQQRITKGILQEILDHGVDGFKAINACNNAGINRSSFYRYFPSVNDAILECVIHFRNIRIEQMQYPLNMDKMSFEELLKRTFTNILDNPEEILLYKNILSASYLKPIIIDLYETGIFNNLNLNEKQQRLLYYTKTIFRVLAIEYIESGVSKQDMIQKFNSYLSMIKDDYL